MLCRLVCGIFDQELIPYHYLCCCCCRRRRWSNS